MKNELSKEMAGELLDKKGKVKGDPILAYLRYIEKIEGDQGLLAVENKLSSIGVELKKSEIDAFGWYPVGWEPLVVLAAKELFEWGDKEIFEMGKNIIKLSLIVKMMLRFFVSIDKAFEESPKYWRNIYNFGEVEPIRRDNGNYVIIIKGYDIHPVSCLYNAGYIAGIVEMTGGKGAEIEEKVCVHKGGECHEYHIKIKS